VGLVWGWFLASMFIFIVGLAMADLGSAMPTSGGCVIDTPTVAGCIADSVGFTGGHTTSHRPGHEIPCASWWATQTPSAWWADFALLTVSLPKPVKTQTD
jgi:hypothetical protein